MADEDDDPLWKRILTNEILWLVIAAALVLGLSFHLATSRSDDPPKAESPSRR